QRLKHNTNFTPENTIQSLRLKNRYILHTSFIPTTTCLDGPSFSAVHPRDTSSSKAKA
ncbi:hypothetical protein GIB67_000610, partial [Kingdonia uniflora]